MSRQFKLLIPALSLTLLASLVMVNAAEATNITLTISTPVIPAGTLTISAPATLDLGTATASSTDTVEMGTITVSDTRNIATGWVVSVIASALTNSSPPANTIIPTYMTYQAGVLTAIGTVTLVATDQNHLTGVVPVVTASLASGIEGATWTPTFILHIPAGAFDGQYTGTITHSVA